MNFYLPIITLCLCAASGAVFFYDIKKHPLPVKSKAKPENAEAAPRAVDAAAETVKAEAETETAAVEAAAETAPETAIEEVKAETAENEPEKPEKPEKPEEKRIPKSAWIYAVIMVCVTVGISFLFATLYKEQSMIANLKRLALLAALWPVAYIDLRSYRIPNAFIIFGLACRVILVIFELIFERRFIVSHLIPEGIAAAALLLASFLCSLFMKNAIGFGDMKLFAVMGLMLGLNGIWGAVFLSLIVSFIAAVILLITKKKTRKDAIPFGPAIVVGTFISVCLLGV